MKKHEQLKEKAYVCADVAQYLDTMIEDELKNAKKYEDAVKEAKDFTTGEEGCEWDVVKGYIQQKESDLLIMYGGGNCTACICHDIEDGDGNTVHNLADFICDKDHLKRILSDENNHWKKYYQEVYLNGKYADNWQIGKLISKQDIRVIYYTDKTCPFNK